MALKRSFEKPGLQNDLPEPIKIAESAAPAQRTIIYRCKLCEYQGPEPHFCPSCLADTMRAIEPDPEKP